MSIRILTAKQMREVDRTSSEKLGIPSLVLMENAGRNVFVTLQDLTVYLGLLQE